MIRFGDFVEQRIIKKKGIYIRALKDVEGFAEIKLENGDTVKWQIKCLKVIQENKFGKI